MITQKQTVTTKSWREYFTMHHARLDTSNYQFDGYGSTDAEARDALRGALEAHGINRKLPSAWWHNFADEIWVEVITSGEGYIDRETVGLTVQD